MPKNARKKIELNANVQAARYPEGRTEADILPSDPNLTVELSDEELQEPTKPVIAEVASTEGEQA